jgi:hypothetical protein
MYPVPELNPVGVILNSNLVPAARDSLPVCGVNVYVVFTAAPEAGKFL